MYRYYVLWYGTGTVMMISWNETERSAHILLCIRVAHEGKHVGLVQCTDTTHENMLSMLNYPYCIKLNNIYVRMWYNASIFNFCKRTKRYRIGNLILPIILDWILRHLWIIKLLESRISQLYAPFFHNYISFCFYPLKYIFFHLENSCERSWMFFLMVLYLITQLKDYSLLRRKN